MAPSKDFARAFGVIHANASSSFFSNVALLDKFVENIRLIIIIDLIIIISQKKDMKSSERNVKSRKVSIRCCLESVVVVGVWVLFV